MTLEIIFMGKKRDVVGTPYARISAMLIRRRWHLVFVLLFVSAALFFFYPQKRLVDEDDTTLSSNDHDSMAQIPLPMNVTDAFCHQCSLCDVQRQHSELKVVQDWDSSRVLRGPPSKHFRGMSYSSENNGNF